jgi:hypothetical protein
MRSNRRRHKRALRWTRYLAHYPTDVKWTPACERAYREAYPTWTGYGHAYDGSDNPYAGPYGQLVLDDMHRLGLADAYA